MSCIDRLILMSEDVRRVFSDIASEGTAYQIQGKRCFLGFQLQSSKKRPVPEMLFCDFSNQRTKLRRESDAVAIFLSRFVV